MHGPAAAPWPAGGAGPEGRPTTPPGGYQAPEPDRFTRFVLRLYERSPRWAVPLAALGCVAVGMGYALISDPTHADPDAAPTCLLKLTTGLDCPGCGGTRALWYLLHGDLPAAARHHFLFVFALPFLAYLFVAWAGNQAFGWRLPELRISSKVIGGLPGRLGGLLGGAQPALGAVHLALRLTAPPSDRPAGAGRSSAVPARLSDCRRPTRRTTVAAELC